ncbi:MAG: CRISPR-associated helicase Cas3' [Nitrospirae bacterium]|nr:CRISPR-associated helicase Cas3' [Nitrospirota bacterium]
MIYFGKPRQCYKCHIKAVHKSWKKLYVQKEKVIRNLCSQHGISLDRFKAASLFSVAFHDSGKPSVSFQQAMHEIAKKNGWANPHVSCLICHNPITAPSAEKKVELYRHEIISGLASLYIATLLDDLYGKLEPNRFPFEFFAVVGHHKPVNPDSFRREWSRFIDEADELGSIGYGEKEWNHVAEIAENILKSEGIAMPSIKWSDIRKGGQAIIEIVKDRIDTIPLMVQEAIGNGGQTKILGRIRETLALLKSLLIAADWEGSSGREIHSVIDLTAPNFWVKVKEEIEKEPEKTFEVKPFQKELTNLAGHGIAVAPTGSGKTEGAIAWALNNRHPNGKILYVLPNQVLTNSIYERLATYFGRDKVGLLHSGALLYQILNRIESDETEQYDITDFAPTEDEETLHTLNKMMFRPIMVTTVDQLLMTAFNGNKRWSVIMGEVMGGAVIFDEVHAYDGHMLALLERVTRELRDYSKLLFMSATMPKTLIAFLSRLLGTEEEGHIVKDETLLQKGRNLYTLVTDKSLVEKERLSKKTLAEIELFIKQDKRVLIVCNTVDTAQKVYSHLHDEIKNTSMCLHSRFIAKDRREKEKSLEKDKSKSKKEQVWPEILVATQVIECGIDIDYDVLLTEGAPLEAIIQRAGRVNRERSEVKGVVYVYKQDEASQKFYPPEITEKGLGILKEKAILNPEITEEELIGMIEDVYKDRKFEEDQRFLNTRRVLDELIYDIGAVQDLPETDLHTRFITYKMVEVVPEEFWNEIKDENQFVIMEHLVKMPLWAYRKAKSHEKTDKWKVMQMKYDPEIGGTFEKDLKSEILFA